jgi:EpsI family protein
MNQRSDFYLRRRAVLVGGLMASAAVAGEVLKPKPAITRPDQMPDLDKIVPQAFGSWMLDRSVIPLEVPADVANTLNAIYDKTLSRTYVNRDGQRVMLSLAYGANQSRALQLHKPEVCYTAQGFRVSQLNPGVMHLGGTDLPVMRLVGQLGNRVEPITYWMRIGNDVVRGWLEQNRVRLAYGLRGQIPDGLLFRVSMISGDLTASYQVQDLFVSTLLGSMSKPNRSVLVGNIPFTV